MSGYRALFETSLADPSGFWAAAAGAVTWTREPNRVLDERNPPFYRWFPDGEMNTCANAPTATSRQGVAISSPWCTTPRHRREADLQLSGASDATARFAGGLRELGVGKGDRVVLYLPMIPGRSLRCLPARGWGGAFGGVRRNAAHELATRIDDAQPAVIVSASCGVEPSRVVAYKPMLDKALELASHKPRACVIVQRDRQRCDLIEGRTWIGLR